MPLSRKNELDLDRLTPNLLRMAYAHGYFPMPDPDTDEIQWYSPDPPAILPLDGFRLSQSLKRSLRKGGFTVTFDRAFEEVMKGCADRPETWITEEFLRVYVSMHQEGGAHSVEVWEGQKLVGGTYGVSLGGAFF